MKNTLEMAYLKHASRIVFWITWLGKLKVFSNNVLYHHLIFSWKIDHHQNIETTNFHPHHHITKQLISQPSIIRKQNTTATTATCNVDMSCDFPNNYQSPSTDWPANYQGEVGPVPYKIKLDTVGVYKSDPSKTAADISKPIKCTMADAKESIMKIVSAE